nr:uncharacterized protein I206_00938 [Kwoniella pini CBS 10737]OCF53632.1 hypothetical protein I206_00938 [Kwoniella pini CBS 10737]
MHAGGGVPSMAYYSYSNQNSPVIETANNDNPFDLANMTIPPRLKSIGRKISQMSNDFMPPDIEDPNTRSKPASPNLEKKQPLGAEVPGMGDEPIMCPFCNKPLPPSLVASQMTSGKHDHTSAPQRPNNLKRASSMRVTSTPSPKLIPSAPLSRVTSANTPPQTQKPTPLLDPLPVQTPGSTKPVEPEPPIPSATSESFAATVKEGDVANHDAAEKMITEEDIKRWSSLSGITLPSTSAAHTASATQSVPQEQKAFPLLPPPPPAASKLTKTPPTERTHSRSSSAKFGFFVGSKKGGEEDEDSEDDDGMATGYTKLTGPASDSEDEEPSQKGGVKLNISKEEIQQQEKKAEEEVEKADVQSAQPEQVEPPRQSVITASAPSAGDGEIRKVLQEVLERVNDLSKTQTALLASHSTLLTSLKIARSNLAMAEANSEMLEEQLKRASTSSNASRTGNSRNVSGPATTPGTPLPVAPQPARASADHVRATTTANATATPAAVTGRAPARASMEDRPRPTSLYVTANDLANAGPGGLSAPSPSSSNNSWGFWNGGKKKVTGALSHVHVPSASSMMDAIGNPSRPGTPNPDGSAPRKSTDSISSWIPSSPAAPYSVPISGNAPSRPPANRTVTHHANLSKSFNDQPSLSRSMSVMNVPAQRSASGSAAAVSVSNAELSKLRQAYSAAVAKMDGMSKELAELKTGKVEMEAELENLSQALFEEANKMVADERRKRAELEEFFKEVKEEREALRETIKVLGGKVEEPSNPPPEGSTEDSKEEEEEDELADDFVPRDLDKHYAALRKSIHHVAARADSSEDEDEDEERRASVPLVSEPGSMTPIATTGGFAIPTSRTSTMTSDEGEDNSSHMLSMSMPSLPAAAESNPWATPAMTKMTPFETPAPRISVKAATPSPHAPPVGLPELPDDSAGEGEAISGLGLDIDKGVVAGEAEAKKEEPLEPLQGK